MAKRSAGLLLYRRGDRGVEVLLVHPGGPFWRAKDLGAWSLAKGEIDPGEEPAACAQREFEEETGTRLEGDLDADAIRSITFELEWPPRSGRRQSYPEVDRAAWFTVDEAREKLNAAQAAFLDRLVALLA